MYFRHTIIPEKKGRREREVSHQKEGNSVKTVSPDWPLLQKLVR